MKDKILTLIIGILIGAILASGGFLIYNNVNSSSNNGPQMTNGEMPQMPTDGEKPDGEPPAKPGEENSTSSDTEKEDASATTQETTTTTNE